MLGLTREDAELFPHDNHNFECGIADNDSQNLSLHRKYEDTADEHQRVCFGIRTWTGRKKVQRKSIKKKRTDRVDMPWKRQFGFA